MPSINRFDTGITETETTAQAEREGPGELLPRLGLIFGLSAIALSFADIVALIVTRGGVLAPPSSTPQALRLIPPIGMILAAAAVGFNLIGAWYLLARHRAFDPKETARDLAIDDVSGLLARIHPGCAVRIATPFGLAAAMLATLLSIWAVPAGEYLHVIGNNTVHACNSSGALSPFSIELDNSASTVSVSWSAAPVETLPDGASWARVVPAMGSLDAGQDQHVSVFPNGLVCDAAVATARTPVHSTGALAVWSTALGSATYHVRVTTSGTSTLQSTLAMSVRQSLSASRSPVPIATPLPTPSPTPTSKPSTKSKPTGTGIAVPTPTRVVIVPAATATATPVPPTPTPCPALGATITAPPNGQTYFTTSSRSISFTGSISGACGAIPSSDITWSVTNTQFFPSPTVMGNGESISYTLQGTLSTVPYDISFQVSDPTSGQTATANISIFVILLLT